MWNKGLLNESHFQIKDAFYEEIKEMAFDIENFKSETKLRNDFIDEFKLCAYADKDGYPNVYVDRVWSIIDKMDEKMKGRVLFWFVTEHLTLINK